MAAGQQVPLSSDGDQQLCHARMRINKQLTLIRLHRPHTRPRKHAGHGLDHGCIPLPITNGLGSLSPLKCVTLRSGPLAALPSTCTQHGLDGGGDSCRQQATPRDNQVCTGCELTGHVLAAVHVKSNAFQCVCYSSTSSTTANSDSCMRA